MIDKGLPFGFIFVNENNFIFGHADLNDHGPKGVKFGDMGGDLGSLGVSFPEVTNADYVKDYSEKEIEAFKKETEVLIPASKGKTTYHKRCFFTSSPDGHFIIDRLPNHRRVTVACGFSGHGFKFMPVIGEILADLAVDGKTKYDIEFMSLKRFDLPKL